MDTAKRLSFFYFTLGVVLNLAPELAGTMYMSGRGIEVDELAKFAALLTVPWCLKPVYGLISDTCPLFGERRRPYIFGANALNAVLWGMMALRADDVTLWYAKTLFFTADDLFDEVFAIVLLRRSMQGQAARSRQVLRCSRGWEPVGCYSILANVALQ